MPAERFHAERKVRITYRNALLGLAGLLLLSLSGNLATDFKDAIPQRRVVLSYLKVAASLPTSVKDSPDPVSHSRCPGWRGALSLRAARRRAGSWPTLP